MGEVSLLWMVVYGKELIIVWMSDATVCLTQVVEKACLRDVSVGRVFCS